MDTRVPLRIQRDPQDPAFANPKVDAQGRETMYAPAGWYKYTRGGNLGWDVPRGPRRAAITVKSTGEMEFAKTAESELDTSDSSRW